MPTRSLCSITSTINISDYHSAGIVALSFRLCGVEPLWHQNSHRFAEAGYHLRMRSMYAPTSRLTIHSRRVLYLVVAICMDLLHRQATLTFRVLLVPHFRAQLGGSRRWIHHCRYRYVYSTNCATVYASLCTNARGQANLHHWTILLTLFDCVQLPVPVTKSCAIQLVAGFHPRVGSVKTPEQT
jgi:hypothetical protein